MSPPTIQPSFDLPVHRVPFTDSLQFAPDGRLYVEELERSLNLWTLLVHYWPETLGGLLAVVAVILMAPIVRTLRRPRVVGAPHCRRCNYNLAATPPGMPCPECGLDPALRRPVIGRSQRRRLAVPVAILGLACAGYATLHLMMFPRDGPLSDRFYWPSPKLAEYARQRNVRWLSMFERSVRTIREIDPGTGKITRVVRSVGDLSAMGLSISPDGRTGVTTLSSGALAAIDLNTGAIRRTAPRPDGGIGAGSKWGGSSWFHVAGWAGNDEAYPQFDNSTAGTNKLYKWNIATGSLTPVIDASASSQQGPSTAPGTARCLYLIPGSNPASVCEVDDPLAEHRNYGSTGHIRVRSLADGSVTKELTGPFWVGVAPTMIAEEQAFFIRGWGSSRQDIMMWSLSDGTEVGGLAAPGFVGTLQEGPAGLAYDQARRRLLVATTEGVFVRDTVSKTWVTRLAFSSGALPDSYIAFSPDGRWLAIIVTVTGPAPGRGPLGPTSFSDHVLIFDLSSLNAPTNGASKPEGDK